MPGGGRRAGLGAGSVSGSGAPAAFREPPGRRGRADPRLAPQRVAVALEAHQRADGVAGRGEPRDQGGVRIFVERVQSGPAPAQRDGAGQLTRSRPAGRAPPAPATAAVCAPRAGRRPSRPRRRPGAAAAQRHGVPHLPARPSWSKAAASTCTAGSSPTRSRDAASRPGPATRRSAHSALRRLVRPDRRRRRARTCPRPRPSDGCRNAARATRARGVPPRARQLDSAPSTSTVSSPSTLTRSMHRMYWPAPTPAPRPQAIPQAARCPSGRAARIKLIGIEQFSNVEWA